MEIKNFISSTKNFFIKNIFVYNTNIFRIEKKTFSFKTSSSVFNSYYSFYSRLENKYTYFALAKRMRKQEKKRTKLRT